MLRVVHRITLRAHNLLRLPHENAGKVSSEICGPRSPGHLVGSLVWSCLRLAILWAGSSLPKCYCLLSTLMSAVLSVCLPASEMRGRTQCAFRSIDPPTHCAHRSIDPLTQCAHRSIDPRTHCASRSIDPPTHCAQRSIDPQTLVSTILLQTPSDHHASLCYAPRQIAAVCTVVGTVNPLRSWSALRCHLMSSVVSGRLSCRPWSRALCRLSCRRPREGVRSAIVSALCRSSRVLFRLFCYKPFQIITHHCVTHPDKLRPYAQACGRLVCEQFGRLRRLSCRRIAGDSCLPSCRLRGFCFSVSCRVPLVFRVLYLVSSVFDVGNLSGTFRKPVGNLSDVLSAPPVSSHIVSRPRVVSTVLSAVLSAHRGGFMSTVLSAPCFLFFRVLSGVRLFSGFVSTILLHTLSDHHSS